MDLQEVTDEIVRLRSPMARRHALGWLAGAGTMALLTGCGSDSGGSPTTIPVTPTPTPVPAPSPSPTPLPTPTPSPKTCTQTPSETTAPYPADGTGATSGSVNNVLNQSGIVRNDIRASFVGSSAIAPGVRLTLNITLQNSGSNCAAVTGYAIYVWHADAQGRFSLYTIPAETYLRGVQVTDGTGKVSFTTIIPGVLSGRYPHIHVAIFPTLASATVGANAVFATQLILPVDLCTAVYADTTTYAGAQTRFGAITLASDPVFGDNSTEQNASRTLTATGTVAAGYTADVTLSPNLGVAI
ncbi:intradiol ring-cleavage dioxygenase [Sphingobium sp. H33]|uniref:Intradiol ring-cleavage dioxygenase n=2 Tax=Sphingobium nicotianae TaxID=2782607 RepID=A0A9X1DAN3_9SPHN|nr:intradiol ring-cleavage dioxygenase [Sphingobium nicotianae]